MQSKFYTYINLFIVSTLLMTSACEKLPPESKEETAIKAASSAYLEAYNQHNATKLTSLWTQDGAYTNLTTHDTIQGRAALTDYFTAQFAKGEGTQLKLTIDTIQLTEPNKAIEKGHGEILYKNKPPIHTVFKAEYVKENNEWLVQKGFEFELRQAPSRYEQLKELHWLLGNWVNDTDNVVTTSTFETDRNKNFIMQHFITRILDQKEIEGHQIISWDPIQKKICSWVFDTDGGIGKSYWTQDKNYWYAHMDYTLADGKKLTSTDVYTKIDTSTYTFASRERMMDGKALPNIGPITSTRK